MHVHVNVGVTDIHVHVVYYSTCKCAYVYMYNYYAMYTYPTMQAAENAWYIGLKCHSNMFQHSNKNGSV